MLKLFVPGRLCLFGEHTDWAGHYRTMNADILPGMAIVTGIEQGIYAEVEKASNFEMHSDAAEPWLDNKEFRSYRWVQPADFDLDSLPAFKRGVYEQVLRDFFGV